VYRILIVEDEPDAAAALRDAIRRYGDEHAEQFQVGWMRNTIDLDEPAFDLIFMDIDLGVENGMDAAREIREFDRSTPIIFVTNLAQYAVQGYEVNALDFIVKPFTYGSFSLRMDRAMEVLRRQEGRSISVQTRDGLRIFPASSLVSVWMRGHDVNYGLSDGSVVTARGSMKETEERLGGTPFLRISSGYIINMSHVRGVKDTAVTLSDGSVCYISRANKKRCLAQISRFLGGGA
jgi:DNA-binding LytR/AlgR family response regulator